MVTEPLNRVIIVTGGANGIGLATVRAFCLNGDRVVAIDLKHEDLSKAKDQLHSEGFDNFFTYTADLTDFSQLQKVIFEIKDSFGSIDVLINNAGILKDRSLLKLSETDWDNVINVNLKAVYQCTQEVAKIMVEQGSGVILNASSVVGLYGNYGQTNYVASKAGIIGMTKVWARELGPKGIRVNAIAPGFIATDMIKAMPQDILDKLAGKAPLKRLGQPEDVANAYVFLASDKASFITGTTLSVDGGVVT